MEVHFGAAAGAALVVAAGAAAVLVGRGVACPFSHAGVFGGKIVK